jgi:NAD(P)-dependent dehydrogenase (short-subunit alcohol dehydrogenase family)
MGKAMVQAFAVAGADVVIASRKLDNCEALAQQVRDRTGRRALAVSAHVGRWDDMDRLAATALDEFGKVDVLVNNAGMSPLYPSLVEVTEDLFDKVVAVNLKGVFRLSALLGTHMAEHDGGSIINVSSTASLKASMNEASYGAAKAGVNNLTLSLAQAFGPKVRVNCIVPGPFLTDIAKAWDMEHFEKVTAQALALKRGGLASEIVGAALYLASDASSFTTGAWLRVDGGVP